MADIVGNYVLPMDGSILPAIPNMGGDAAAAAPTASWGDFLKGLFGSKDGAKDLSTGLGLNIGTGQLALGGLQALGNLYSSFQAQDLARKQFNFAKEFASANLANQIKSYNTRLDDKINSRAFTEGRPAGWAQDYLNQNRLTRSVG